MHKGNIRALVVTLIAILLPWTQVIFKEHFAERNACPIARSKYGNSVQALYMHGGGTQMTIFEKACKEEAKRK